MSNTCQKLSMVNSELTLCTQLPHCYEAVVASHSCTFCSLLSRVFRMIRQRVVSSELIRLCVPCAPSCTLWPEKNGSQRTQRATKSTKSLHNRIAIGTSEWHNGSQI